MSPLVMSEAANADNSCNISHMPRHRAMARGEWNGYDLGLCHPASERAMALTLDGEQVAWSYDS